MDREERLLAILREWGPGEEIQFGVEEPDSLVHLLADAWLLQKDLEVLEEMAQARGGFIEACGENRE